MALAYLHTKTPGAAGEIVRSFAVSYPVDWYDQVAAGPLPVILVIHPGGSSPAEFLPIVDDVGIWSGAHSAGVPIKAIIVAPAGVSLEGGGGEWNSGHISSKMRTVAVDDVDFPLDLLESVDRLLVNHHNAEYGAGLTVALDQSRLMIVAFSVGGEMAYRVAWEAENGNFGAWTVTALGVCGTTLGGYRSINAFLAGDPAEADWTPVSPPSVLHIHGENDNKVRWKHSGGMDPDPEVADAPRATADEQTGNWPEYARADFTGEGTRQKLSAAMTAVHGVATSVAPPLVLPASMGATAEEWTTAGGATVAVFFYNHPGGHDYPTAAGFHATDHIIDFFQRYGGL